MPPMPPAPPEPSEPLHLGRRIAVMLALLALVAAAWWLGAPSL